MPSVTTTSEQLRSSDDAAPAGAGPASARSGFRLTRRQLRAALGVLWVIAACLQFQPFMFSKGLALEIVAPEAAGQPPIVTGPVGLFVRAVSSHPAAFNWVFAPAELGIGVALLLVSRHRAARWVSGVGVAMALGIWWLGESMGGVLTGSAAGSMGAPGAALLYAVIGLAAWPTRADDDRPARWLPAAWFVIWGGTAALSALPAATTPDGLAGQVLMGSTMSPGFLARPEYAFAERISRLSAGTALMVATVIVAVQVMIAIGGLLTGRLRTIAAVLALAFAAVTWVLCQGFGGISTGEATDVATAPLLALLTAALLSTSGVRRIR